MKQNCKSNWLVPFVIALVLAIAATAAAVVIGVLANRPPEYTEGSEMGVYYYDVEDGEVLLTLSTGNNFTLAGNGINKTGTYTVEGNTLNLTFFKEADGTTTATVNGDSISLVFGEATMNFLKKVDYTVSFDVNGGVAIDPVKVLNGKAVEEPATPVKDGSVFLGWYADKDLKVPFTFETLPIKNDTTIYAKWAAKTLGVSEYTVDFDLGYDAPALESITTISGKAYGVTEPKRDGYTFGGWWISMYEDGQKLSYAYTDDTVFTADTTLFAVWYENGATKLNAPAVSVDGQLISWKQVSGATGYILTVTAPDGTVLIDGESIAATVKTYDFSALAAGEYVISVVAVASNEENNSDATVRYYANKALDRVSEFQVVNGILVFGGVKNAEKYLITVDCGNDEHVHTNFDNGTRTTFYLANCPMQEGGIKITVTALANGYASSTSKTFAYDLTLDKITKIEYNAATDSFIWDAVADATDYIVTVTIGGNTYTYTTDGFNSFSAAPFTGDITVSVVPATEGYNSPEGTEATCTKTAPAMPTGLSINNMTLTWAEAAGATSYEVKVGNQTVIVNTNSLNFTSSAFALTQGEFYEAQVRAISASNEASVYSAALKFGYFAMSGNLSYSKNTVSWSPILGVNSFVVRVNGENEFTVNDATSARVTLTKEGANLIEVKYVTESDESEWASITVNAIAVEYDSRSNFGSFYTEYLAVGDEYTLPGTTFATGFSRDGYNFIAWATSPFGSASNGAVLADGAIFTGNAYTILYATWTPKEYKITLNTQGSGFSYDNIQNGDEVIVTYTKNFTLPVPNTGDIGIYKFDGWYTQPNGEGRKIADSTGASIEPYPYTRDLTLYPYFNTSALRFILNSDGQSYTVTRGESIGEVTDLVIPVTWKDKPVTIMEAHAFSVCTNLLTIKIPDTIELVELTSIRSANNLRSIEVYEAKPGEVYEKFYASANGALLRLDTGIWYLEIVPKAINELSDTGTFVIPDTVTTIAPEAFRYCRVEHVIIPDNVIGFPEYAFKSCINLKSVTFAEGRTNPVNMTNKTFVDCNSIETFNLPANFNMDIDSFKSFLGQFRKLKAVNIAEGNPNYTSISGILTNADGDTFIYCPKGYQGTPIIPRSITKIDESAFAGCTGITDITIPVWVTSIGKQAFSSASSITSVTFEGGRSENLTIGDGAFRTTSALKTVTFDGTETDTGEITVSANAFYGGTTASLESVTVKKGANIKSLGNYAFYQQPKLTSFVVESGATLGTIGSYAFAGCTALESFEVPSTTTSIAQYAFSGCIALANLTFDMATSDKALSISNFAFNNCTKLRAVVLPDRLGSFNSAAFEGCTTLKSISVNDTNPNYKTDNGILYKKSSADSDDFAELLFYPTALITENNGVINNLPSTLTKIGGSAFSNNLGLISITLPASIISIDTAAFKNCESLEEVIFLGSTAGVPEGTTLAIGESAFENCYSLNKIVLPAYTKSVGQSSFRKAGLVNLTIPASITSIGNQAFNGCTKLETLVFNNTASISLPDGGLFKGCTALKSVNFGANVSTVGESAFEGCTHLETVSFACENSKLTRIENKAFYNCPKLQTINIPKTIKAIGGNAFAATASAPGSLTNINFELGGTDTLHIYEKAFQYQPALKSIVFPANVSLYTGATNTTTDANGNKTAKPVTYADFNAKTTNNGIADLFAGCLALESLTIASEEGVTGSYATQDGVLYSADMTVLIFCPAANAGDSNNKLTIPTSVKLVMSKAFLNNTKLTSITFAEFDKSDAKYGTQILMIGHCSSVNVSYAVFGGVSTSITEVKLPSHLSTIRGYAFAVTGATKTPMAITINSDAKNITLSNYAFNQSTAKELALPSVKSLGTYAFANTKLLEEVTLTFTGTTLPNYVFQNAVALKSFEIPSKVTTIGNNAFDGCTSLTSVTIPSTVTKINQTAFSKCASLTSITLPSNLSTLSAYAFAESGIVSITIPSKVTTINNQLFKGCTSLKSITFQGKIKSFSTEMCFGCVNLETVTVSDASALTSIGSYAFVGCEKFATLDFTKLTKVSSIGTNAFSHTAFEKVDLSKMSSLTKLNNSFNNMPKLKEFVFAPKMSQFATQNFTAATTYNGYLAQGLPFENDPALVKVTLGSSFTTDLLGVNTSNSTLPTYLFADYMNNPNFQIIVPDTLTNYTRDEATGIYFDGDILAWAPAWINLEEYYVPDNIYLIDKYAFAYSNIGKIVVHRNVEEIGEGAFLGANTTEIVVSDTLAEPSYLTYIGDYAFAGSKIESFIIPDNVSVDDLYYPYDPKNPDWPSGGLGVACGWFAYCPNLKSLTLGSGMKCVPDGIALGTTTLEELKLPNTIEYIGYIFMDPSAYADSYTWLIDMSTVPTFEHSLKSITIPASVNTLYGSFFGMSGLETVTFADGSQLMFIDALSFGNCTSLKSITLPSTLIYLGEAAFYGATALESADLSKTQLTMIGEYAFENTTSLATVSFPATLTAIGNHAFYNSGIIDLTIPATVTDIGTAAFMNMTKLKTLTIEEGSPITALGEYIYVTGEISWGNFAYEDDTASIFGGTTSLETVTIPNTVTSIEANTFENSGVQQILMSDPTGDTALNYIGDKAFAGCTRLTYFGYIENPDDPESMKVYNYLENVTEIGEQAFFGCSALTSVDFSQKINYIGTMAFAYCTALESAYIPASLIELGGNPYAGLDASKIAIDPANGAFVIETDANGVVTLKHVETGTIYGVWGATGEYEILGDSQYVPYAEGALAGNAITKVTIPAKMTNIPAYLFMNCAQLAEVIIEEGVKTIGAYAFYGTAVTEIVLPSTITFNATSIGEGAFANCKELVKFSINTNPTSYSTKFVAPESIFAGSDKVEISTETISNANFYLIAALASTGYTELHVETMDAENSVANLSSSAGLHRVATEFTLYFDTTSYEDIIELFSTYTGSSTSWDVNVTVYDANGNQLICGTNGAIVLVVDAQGNTIWQA